MPKKKTNIDEEKIREEAGLLEKSFNFWVEQVDKVLLELDILEKQMEKESYSPELDQKLEILENKLKSLIAKGALEDQAMEKLQHKIDVHTNPSNKDDKTLFLDGLKLG